MTSVDIILATDIDFSYVFTFSILIDTFIEASLEAIEVTVIVLLSDSNLFTNIQDFYLFNNYNVEAKSYEISSLVSSLGLTKKTDNDRRDAGIIY